MLPLINKFSYPLIVWINLLDFIWEFQTLLMSPFPVYARAAEHWFLEAKERHSTLSASIYGNIIYANCQSCNMDRAEELLREMEEEGIAAPISIFHTMMDGYTITRNEEKCLLMFDRLKILTSIGAAGVWLYTVSNQLWMSH
nr:pentatricopeptide repeat-containing protein At5g04810, chloroplastic [Ipomoea batatas]